MGIGVIVVSEFPACSAFRHRLGLPRTSRRTDADALTGYDIRALLVDHRVPPEECPVGHVVVQCDIETVVSFLDDVCLAFLWQAESLLSF